MIEIGHLIDRADKHVQITLHSLYTFCTALVRPLGTPAVYPMVEARTKYFFPSVTSACYELELLKGKLVEKR